MSELEAQRRNRRNVIILALVFFAPALFAYVLYLSGWRSETTRNYGVLIDPPRPLNAAGLLTLDGKPVDRESLTRKWSIVYIGSGECVAECQETMAMLRQLYVSLAKNQRRVQRLFVITDGELRGPMKAPLEADSELLLLKLAKDVTSGSFLEQFSTEADSRVGLDSAIYLMDPIGNLMMVYRAPVDPKKMRKDLSRLLHFSQIG